jgi:hypothetical protein
MVGLPFLKKEPEAIPRKGFVPIDRVRELASSGFPESDIINTLREEGFSASEIDKALTQALKIGVTGEPKKEEREKSEEGPKLPKLEDISPPEKPETPGVPETPLPEEYYAPDYSTEDYIDYIVESRLNEVKDNVNQFNIKYQELEKRIGLISKQLNEMARLKTSEQETLLNKIDSFKESIEGFNTRLAGLERAFKETLPALIESVRALSGLVQRFKKV